MAKAKDNGPTAVEGYNMLIWENSDGTAFYTGSLNVGEWDRYLDESGNRVAEGVEVPEAPELAEQPAKNASRDDWADYARSRGAADVDLLDEDGKDLGRDALREKFGSESA